MRPLANAIAQLVEDISQGKLDALATGNQLSTLGARQRGEQQISTQDFRRCGRRDHVLCADALAVHRAVTRSCDAESVHFRTPVASRLHLRLQ
jgi:hypothetical protein